LGKIDTAGRFPEMVFRSLWLSPCGIPSVASKDNETISILGTTEVSAIANQANLNPIANILLLPFTIFKGTVARR
jgi:hypothetical protein